ncbi:hypothetical protein CAP35_09235 [Chitinophagaceae bacterium IBVUCB1]|nr:hypothetical protein CAP35_09235 [Chitinophagaceae bacterium IBVUCB1]
MPAMDTRQLLQLLNRQVEATINRTVALQSIEADKLNTQPAAGKWSAAQIIEHLNSYNRYYLPEMEKAMQKQLPFNAVFNPGWFGNYFTNMMLPKKDGKIANKMNSPKDHRPPQQLDAVKVVGEFIKGQQQLLSLLQKAGSTDIGKVCVPISLSRLIKLKLGDTFRFLIAHQQRHFIQLENVLDTI